jgi:hypothetical protein
MKNLQNNENWNTLLKFLPEGWDDKAMEFGALIRRRNIKSPEVLLRLLLLYLSDDKSLLVTAAQAEESGLASISDVGLLKRLRSSSLWFRWLSRELLNRRGIPNKPPPKFDNFNIITVDASVISEPGSTGADWRLHYSKELFSSQGKEMIITNKRTGETLKNFSVNKNDLFIGDRVYGRYMSIKHVLDNGGHFIVRYMNKSFTMLDSEGNKINMYHKVKNLEVGEIKEFKANVKSGNSEALPVRFCILKKSKEKGDEAVRRTLREQKKKQRKVYEETLELHRYVIVMTSLPDEITSQEILELYRLRWQIEIAFKRLKSIFSLGHLPKKDPESAKSWLQGKIFLAVLTQTIADESYLFSPWGYPIKK